MRAARPQPDRPARLGRGPPRGRVRAAADLVLLDAAEAAARCHADGVRGGTYTPHCAAVHPAKLVRG
ncbi:hypothetical protein F8274_30710, partial [Micromonospora sp. AMSO31t]